jgi:hypothetical protein
MTANANVKGKAKGNAKATANATAKAKANATTTADGWDGVGVEKQVSPLRCAPVEMTIPVVVL